MRSALFLLLLSNLTMAVGQSVSSVNKHVTFSDYIAGNVIRSAPCLRSFHDVLTTFKEKNPGVYISYDKMKCVLQPNEYYYTEANTAANVGVHDSWQQYNLLYEKNNELITYIRLEDHKTDKGVQGFQLVNEMSAATEHLADNRNALKAVIYANRNNFIQGASGKAYQLMIDLAHHEEKVLKHLDVNYKNNGAVGLDEAFMNQSYLETADILAQLQKSAAVQYPASSYLKSFIAGVQSLQSIKQTGVDKNSYTNKMSTRYVNNFYKDYLNYFNNSVLSFLQAYVKASQDKGMSMYFYPKYILLYRMKDYQIEVPLEVKQFEDKAVPPIQVSKRVDELNKSTYDVLNGYILGMNERTHSLSNIQNTIRNFQSSLNYLKNRNQEQRARSNLYFKFEYYLIPENDLAILKKQTPLLLPAYSNSLLTQFTTLQEIMLEGERLCEELAEYATNKKFINGDFSRPEEILRRLSTLCDIYEIKKERLYEDARAIYSSFKVGNPANPWKVTSNAMQKATDAGKSTLKDIKNKFYEGAPKIIATESLIAARRDLITNQSKYMAGIKRLGTSHGHCPYTPYESIPDEIQYLTDKVGNIDTQLAKGEYSKYGDYVYRYNEIARHYNKFAELGKGEVETARNDTNRPIYILSQTTTFTKFILDEQKPSAAEVVAISSVSLLDADKANEQEAVTIEEPTIAKADNTNDSREVMRDTVYIETVRTDTIYLHEDAVDFTSFEGYAHNNLVFLLDVSGSMNKPNKLPVLKKSIQYLVSLMRPVDEISIVVYSGKAKLALKPSSASEGAKIDAVISNLQSEGKTNTNEGIKLAYKVADDNYKRGGNNRIILATDGEVDVSKTSMNTIEKFASQDIQLSVITFGSSDTSSRLQKLSKAGGGNYKHITEQNLNSQLIREAKSKKIK